MSVRRGLSPLRDVVRSSMVAYEGTHHVWKPAFASNERVALSPLYTARYRTVLPFHSPGLAPAQDERTGEWMHITRDGVAAYQKRYARVFGFYEGLAAVEQRERGGQRVAYHVGPDGDPAYEAAVACGWSWAGNFQGGRCVVEKAGMFHHIRPDGSVVPGGPHLYAGDFRENYAVIRCDKRRLCSHIDLEGHLLHGKWFIDLDVFHKSTARARDAGGWFHINKRGEDVSDGRRFSALEPFYNGRAIAQDAHTMERLIIDEHGREVVRMPLSKVEAEAILHERSVAYWQSFALKVGLETGVVDAIVSVSEFSAQPNCWGPATESAASALINVLGPDTLRSDSVIAVLGGLADMGIVTVREDRVALTELGGHLRMGCPARRRVEYFLGAQLEPWLDANERLRSPPGDIDFFSDLSPSDASVCAAALATYEEEDFGGSELLDALGLHDGCRVVDIGGGTGGLLRRIRNRYPSASCVLFEKPSVVRMVEEGEDDSDGLECVPGDMFVDEIPRAGDVYVLCRVLHDWDDQRATHLLERLRRACPVGSGKRLLVVDRAIDARRNCHEGTHGLLNLNMRLTTGGKERSMEQWRTLFNTCGWTPHDAVSLVSDHCIFKLS